MQLTSCGTHISSCLQNVSDLRAPLPACLAVLALVGLNSYASDTLPACRMYVTHTTHCLLAYIEVLWSFSLAGISFNCASDTLFGCRMYVTPKSYLDLIALYIQLLRERRTALALARERLLNGLAKLQVGGSRRW